MMTLTVENCIQMLWFVKIKHNLGWITTAIWISLLFVSLDWAAVKHILHASSQPPNYSIVIHIPVWNLHIKEFTSVRPHYSKWVCWPVTCWGPQVTLFNKSCNVQCKFNTHPALSELRLFPGLLLSACPIFHLEFVLKRLKPNFMKRCRLYGTFCHLVCYPCPETQNKQAVCSVLISG